MVTRRSFIVSICGTVAIGGCLGLGQPDSGDLHVQNDSSTTLTVAVTAQRMSADTDVPQIEPRPDREPISEQHRELTVDAGGERLVDGFVDEQGIYFVEAAVEGGGTATDWMEFYRAVDGGLGPGWITVTLDERDSVSLGIDDPE